MKKYVSIALLLSLMFSLSACTESEASDLPKTSIPKIDTELTELSTYEKEYYYPGFLSAEKKVDLSAKSIGQVEAIYVSPGEQVEKGALLAIIGDIDNDYELQISLDSSKDLYKSIEEMLVLTNSTNLKQIESAASKIEIEKVNLKKAIEYKQDLITTYNARIEQAKNQSEKARINYEMALNNLDNYKLQGDSLKLGSENQIIEASNSRQVLDSALRNAKDLASQLEDQAQDSIDQAEKLLESAKDELVFLENNGASSNDILKANMEVEQLRQDLKKAEDYLERIEIENDSNIDSLRNNIEIAETRIAGTVYQDITEEISIKNQLDNLKYNQNIAEQSYFESISNLSFIDGQMKQEVNSAQNSIFLIEKAISDHEINLGLTKQNTARLEAEIKTRLEDLNGQIKLLESKVEKQKLLAPFDGVISSQYIEVGQAVTQGTLMFEITNLDSLKVQWHLPESRLSMVETGKVVQVLIDERKIDAIITEIEPGAGKYSKKVRIEAVLQEETSFVDNSYVEVSISKVSNDKVIMVPLTSIVTKYKDSFVYVIKEGILILTAIKLDITIEDQIIVTEGLGIGDIIVKNPTKDLYNGLKIN
jgi:RND family efflux transporter MFP subunit